MSSPPTRRTNMTPGKPNDCGITGCTGTEGGVCVAVEEGDLLWCCLPYATTCWGSNQFHCDEPQTQMTCFVTQTQWCCNSTLEACDSRALGCTPNSFENPALKGPVWSNTDPGGNTSPTQTPTPTPDSSSLSGGAAAGIGVGVFLMVCGAVGAVFWFRKRRSEDNLSPTELETLAGGYVSHEDQIHELETAPPAAVIHELAITAREPKKKKGD